MPNKLIHTGIIRIFLVLTSNLSFSRYEYTLQENH